MSKKLCPLFKIATPTGDAFCKKEECQWWSLFTGDFTGGMTEEKKENEVWGCAVQALPFLILGVKP